MNYNINSYSIQQLLEIYNLEPNFSREDVENAISNAISLTTRMNNSEGTEFAQEAGNRLLAYLDGNDAEGDMDNSWLASDAMVDHSSNPDYSHKNPVSAHSDDNINILHRQTTAASQQQQQQQGNPIIQGTINPNLSTQFTRTVNIDSSKRRNILPYNDENPNYFTSPTRFTMHLNNPLTNVLSYSLDSVTIPFTFYPFDRSRGNNFLWISIYPYTSGSTAPTYDSDTDTVSVSGGSYNGIPICKDLFLELPIGAYDKTNIIAALNTLFTTTLSGKLPGETIPSITFALGPSNMRLNISCSSEVPTTEYLIVLSYFDIKERLPIDIPASSSCQRSHKIDSCLGWKLGARNIQGIEKPRLLNTFTTESATATTPLVLESTIDLNPSPYMVLLLDDANYNYIENGEMNVVDTLPIQAGEYTKDLMKAGLPKCVSTVGLAGETIKTELYPPEEPRVRTFSQLLALNARTFKPDQLYNNYRSFGANLPNTFAIFNYNLSGTSGTDGGTSFGSILSTTISGNANRQFFGPVNIDRFQIRLVDSEGHTVNLHGANWSFQLTVTQLYQY